MSLLQKIHGKSPSAINSRLNVFAIEPTNITANRVIVRELYPVTVPSHEGPWNFKVLIL
jgi:hypothetical protein